MRRRWIGIRASAALGILGSAATLFLAGFLAWTAFHAKLRDAAASPLPLKTILLVTSVLPTGLGLWGIWTAVGVFRRRGWARISTLVLAALVAFIGSVAMLGTLVVPFPPTPGVPAWVMQHTRWAIAAFYGALALIGAWWLVLFNTGATKEYFAEREPAPESARPLSIAIIGWYLLTAAVGTALEAVLRMPAVLAGMIFAGWAAMAVNTAFTAVSIYLGARIWVFGLIGAAACAMPIWFLVRRRAAFAQA